MTLTSGDEDPVLLDVQVDRAEIDADPIATSPSWRSRWSTPAGPCTSEDRP